MIPVAVAILLTLFAWPQANLEPRGVPLGAAGPPQAVESVERELSRDGAFDVRTYADEAAAQQAVEDREVYGAVVVSPAGPRIYTASAGSPAVATALEDEIAPALAGEGDTGSVVTDLVPSDEDDPRGVAFNSSVLPLLIAGLLTGVLVGTITQPGLRQAGTLVIASLLAGLAAVAVSQAWLGIIDGSWLANAGVLSLMVLAISAPVAGLMALLGHAGIGVAAVLMVLIGNPWSGLASAPELLPTPIGAIGQLFPPAAGGNALRSTAFFDGADLGGYLAVLLGWVALGFGAMALAVARKPGGSGQPARATA